MSQHVSTHEVVSVGQDLSNRDKLVISVAEITRLQYNQGRKFKDDIVAETKFGYVIKHGDQYTAYIENEHSNKCYRGALWTDDPLIFQTGVLDEIQTSITVVISQPEPKSKPTKSKSGTK